jgi:hypothetical protein
VKRFLKVMLVALLVAIALPGWGQSDRGGVSGKITDSSGAVLPNATVTLTGVATGVAQTATTNNSGDYTFQLLNPGAYNLTVSSPGFKTEKRSNVVVDVGQVRQ